LQIFLSCKDEKSNRVKVEPKYFDYENSWEQRNLFGKVKYISTYRANYTSTGKLDEKRLQSRIWFSDFGTIKKAEYYDTFGKKTQTENYVYDKNEYLVTAETNNLSAKHKVLQLFKNDTINKITSQQIFINDSLTERFIIYYDENDRIIKHIEIEKTDTIEYAHHLKFDNRDNLVSERQVPSNIHKKIIVDSFAYNKKNRLIYSSNSTNSTEFIRIFEWEDNKLVSEKNYFVFADETKHLNSQTEFDYLYNPTNIKNYTDEKPTQEYKYEYSFDKQNNWIKQTVYIKQIRSGQGDFVKAYADTREIKYW
tara:strand:+ start:9279 stop:10205 length:927 start_codon:yes stop_codon:yes gene_type:complete